MTEPMPDQTPEPPLQSDAALAELRARLAADGTLAPVPEELAPLCPVCLCGVVDDVVDLDDGSLIHGECMPVDVMIGQINTERDESARLRARIAELEREVTKWHGMYRVASDRRDQNLSDYQQASRWAAWFAAERDYWRDEARAARAAAINLHADKNVLKGQLRAARRLGTETGTRPAAVQSDPAGYVVVTRNPEGGLHRSATAWNDLERATAAGDFQARHAEGTGCSAAVYELLREVQQ